MEPVAPEPTPVEAEVEESETTPPTTDEANLSEGVLRLLRQDDIRKKASEKGDEAWTTVYRSWRDDLENGGEFSCFARLNLRSVDSGDCR